MTLTDSDKLWGDRVTTAAWMLSGFILGLLVAWCVPGCI